jgi:hypothetical protein
MVGPGQLVAAWPALTATLAVLGGSGTAGRLPRMAPLLGSGAGLAIAAGWMLLTGRHGGLSVLLHPVAWLDRVAVCAVLAAVLVALPGRAGCWAGWTVPVLLGWWLAQAVAPRTEYWRVGLGVMVAIWIAVRIMGDAPRVAAAALGLLATALVLPAGTAAAPYAVVLVLGAGALAWPALARGQVAVAGAAAGLAAAVSLESGRIRTGGMGAAELVALTPLLAASLTRPVAALAARVWRPLPPAGKGTRRAKATGRGRTKIRAQGPAMTSRTAWPWLAAMAAALLATGIAWGAGRFIR